jgi:small subunit ribosomal protein S5
MSTASIRRVKTTDLDLKDRLVSIQRVTKVTKGGRTFSFSAIVVVGNEDGIVGYGLGKANEVTTAIAKGVEDAKKNLIKVPVHKGTIPHEPEVLCVLFSRVWELKMFWQNPKGLPILITL